MEDDATWRIPAWCKYKHYYAERTKK